MKRKAILLLVIMYAIFAVSCGSTAESSGSSVVETYNFSETNSIAVSEASAATSDNITETTAETLQQTTTTQTEILTTTTSLVTTSSSLTSAASSTTSVTTVVSQPADTKNVDEKLADVFDQLSISGALYRIYAAKADGELIADVGNFNTKMVSASLIKLYVAAAAYENMEVLLPYESCPGETESLIGIMISRSDNDACNTLVRRLGNGDAQSGMDIVNSFCSSHGFNNTSMNRLMLDFNGLENYTTPYDCCNILRAFYYGQLTGSENIISHMKAQVTKSKIPAGITDGTVVANKSGELYNVENDAAIVYADFGTYFMCVMTNQVNDTYTARCAIASSAAIINEYLNYY